MERASSCCSVPRGGVCQPNVGAESTVGAGRGALKGELRRTVIYCWVPPSVDDSPSFALPQTIPKFSLMILSSQKLPELWDYFLIYVSGALEFNPDSEDVDLGLFPLRMNPTIKTR